MFVFEDKFSMTKEQNIFVAKRNLIDYIWKSANLEGIGITFPDTYTICNGMALSGYTVDDINKVNDLKKGWEFILNTIDRDIDISYIKELHKIVGKNTVLNAGSFKLGATGVGGTDWISPPPSEFIVKTELGEIFKIKNATERSLNLMLYLMRGQLFYDGNKRISTLIGNKEMIRNGSGIISIPIDKQPVFLKMLVRFYETNNKDDIMKYLYDNCIDGINFARDNDTEKTPENSIKNLVKKAEAKLDQDNITVTKKKNMDMDL